MRNRQVQQLCRELRQLVELSREQRRTIGGLLAELQGVMRRAQLHRLARGVGRAAGSFTT
ncbi:MAG: hypothetical protein ABIT71_19955 [Vicinamibacteraceae bacterium]